MDRTYRERSGVMALMALVVGLLLTACGGFSYPGSDNPELTQSERDFLRAFEEAYTSDPGDRIGIPGATAEEMLALGYLACAQSEEDFQVIAGRTPETGQLPLNNWGARSVWGIAHGRTGYSGYVAEIPLTGMLCTATATRSLSNDDVLSILVRL